ncbi:MAG: hypothetical protein LBT17_01650 [Mycoplasmataceae bacterium]|nr:hypothetical protein [Mycoplasmataceae bacterium]
MEIKFEKKQPKATKDLDTTHIIVKALASTERNLFVESQTLSFCDEDGTTNHMHNSLNYSNYLYFNDTDVNFFYIKLNSPSQLSDISYLIKLDIDVFFDNHASSQVQSDFYVNLITPFATSPDPTAYVVRNKRYELEDIADANAGNIDGMKEQFINNLVSATEFNNLPIAQTKIDISNLTYYQSLDQLHKYDNAESIVLILLLDYFYTWTKATTPDVEEYTLFALDIYNVTKLGVDAETDAQLFNIYFTDWGSVGGWEYPDTSFMAVEQNFSSAYQWPIEWALRLNMQTGAYGENETGYLEIEDQSFCNDVLKVIYKDVVQDGKWPTSWN